MSRVVAVAVLTTALFGLCQGCGGGGSKVTNTGTNTGIVCANNHCVQPMKNSGRNTSIVCTNGRCVQTNPRNGVTTCTYNEVKIKWGSDGVPKLVKGPENTDVQAKYQVCLKTLEQAEAREKRLEEEAEAREKQAEALQKRLEEEAEAREKQAEALQKRLEEEAEAREKQAEAREKRLAERMRRLRESLANRG